MPGREDILRVILQELDGVPNVGNDELHEARDAAIELQLTNRFAHVKGVFYKLEAQLYRFTYP